MQIALKADKDIVIFVDNRESSRVIPILQKKCVIRKKYLDTADYLLSDRVACERKTTGDFLQSIIDGRLFKQLLRMRKDFECPILIIEGDSVFDLIERENRKIHPNAVSGALAAIVLLSIPILWTRTQRETASLLLAIARREQLHKKHEIAIRNKKRTRSLNQEQEFLIAGLPKISTKMAKKLLKHFGSPEKIFGASEDELMRVDGIGKKMAKRIKKVLTKEYERSILE